MTNAQTESFEPSREWHGNPALTAFIHDQFREMIGPAVFNRM